MFSSQGVVTIRTLRSESPDLQIDDALTFNTLRVVGEDSAIATASIADVLSVKLVTLITNVVSYKSSFPPTPLSTHNIHIHIVKPRYLSRKHRLSLHLHQSPCGWLGKVSMRPHPPTESVDRCRHV